MLAVADLKARQSAKIRQLGEALVAAGYPRIRRSSESARTFPKYDLDNLEGEPQKFGTFSSNHQSHVDVSTASFQR